jgi:hypothetical protein
VIRVYDVALTQAQIVADLNKPITAKVTKARKVKRSKGGAKVTRYRGAAKPRH